MQPVLSCHPETDSDLGFLIIFHNSWASALVFRHRVTSWVMKALFNERNQHDVQSEPLISDLLNIVSLKREHAIFSVSSRHSVGKLEFMREASQKGAQPNGDFCLVGVSLRSQWFSLNEV